MFAYPLNPIVPVLSRPPSAVTEDTLAGPSVSATTGFVGVTDTEVPYEPYAPMLSINLARSHLLFVFGTITIAGFEDPENTFVYPVVGAVADADSTSSTSILLKVVSAGVV